MSVDVNAVNERLNGLVTLLKAVGVDDLNAGDMDRVSKGLKNNKNGSLPDSRQLNDDQIELIIKKLQMAQQEAPQIIAALEAQAEARSLNGNQSKGRRNEEEEEDDDDDEEDDDFDEDANYPMVGHGCSDDISVISDLTTPTVVNDNHVPEEEKYLNDALPPMVVGGGGGPSMLLSQPKKKNMIGGGRPGQSRNRLAPPSSQRKGGAAAARHQRHQETMHKLQDNTPPPKKTVRKSKDSKKSRKPRSTPESESYNQWESGANQGWGEQQQSRKPKKKSTTAIDDDGFLVAESFDPFATGGSNPFTTPASSSAGDLEFGSASGQRDPFATGNGFNAFSSSSPTPRKPKKKSGNMQGSFSSAQSGQRKASAGAAPRRRARRASLAM